MAHEVFLNGKVQLCCGDSLHFLRDQPNNRYDSVVTDPPYALTSIAKRFANSPRSEATENTENPYGRTVRGFMGQRWDTGETAFAVEFWAEVLRVLKPGGHVVAFGGTRTYHRLACAIEDAGFEIRDMLSWLYGSGFPKSHDVAKGLDKRGGHHRGQAGMPIPFQSVAKGQEYVRTPKGAPVLDESKQWDGWGTALKPACEPICFGRKPLDRNNTVTANVLQHGTGAINIAGCRVGEREARNRSASIGFGGSEAQGLVVDGGEGRWPANIIHDGSDEVITAFPNIDTQRSIITSTPGSVYGNGAGLPSHTGIYGADESGSVARFFYTAKADSDDRLGSKHPTVKPVDLMQWLVRLVTPKGGLVLDPFAGTGTTAEACYREGMRCMLIERETDYQADIRRRMALCMAGPDERRRESIKEKTKGLPQDHGPLFS